MEWKHGRSLLWVMGSCLAVSCVFKADLDDDDDDDDELDGLSTGDADSEDSALPGIHLDQDDTGPVLECQPHIRVHGARLEELGDPRVGESWEVLMWCDNILELGAYVLQIIPPHLGTIDESNPLVTFTTMGSGTLFLQVGLKEAEEAITVVQN